jgi:hypothetical protein
MGSAIHGQVLTPHQTAARNVLETLDELGQRLVDVERSTVERNQLRGDALVSAQR